MSDSQKRKFNHDLLLSQADQEYARTQWPAVADLLINTPLVEGFLPHENRAKKLKKVVYTLGTTAVLLMLIALIVSVLEMWENPKTLQPIVTIKPWIVELIAATGLIAAFLSSRYGPFRRAWLKARFVAEISRCWHFRYLLQSFSQITSPGFNSGTFVAQRNQAFSAFMRRIVPEQAEFMSRLADQDDSPLPELDINQLVEETNPEFVELLGAFAELRLDHQYNYCLHKLGPEERTLPGLSNDILVKASDVLAGFSLLFAMILSIVQVATGGDSRITLVALSLVVVGVAARAWRDGLQLTQERQSYIDYSNKLGRLHTLWHNGATTSHTRYLAACEVEDAATDELAKFLRNHERAQFLF